MKKLDAKLAELIRVRGTKIGPEHKECFAYVSELPTHLRAQLWKRAYVAWVSGDYVYGVTQKEFCI